MFVAQDCFMRIMVDIDVILNLYLTSVTMKVLGLILLIAVSFASAKSTIARASYDFSSCEVTPSALPMQFPEGACVSYGSFASLVSALTFMRVI